MKFYPIAKFSQGDAEGNDSILGFDRFDDLSDGFPVRPAERTTMRFFDVDNVYPGLNRDAGLFGITNADQ